MKVTQEMMDAYCRAEQAPDLDDAERVEAGIQAVLDLLPDVRPFTFTGHENLHAYIHPPCSTVIDVNPAMNGITGSINEQVAAGECDCENTQPWLRIYVEAS